MYANSDKRNDVSSMVWFNGIKCYSKERKLTTQMYSYVQIEFY